MIKKTSKSEITVRKYEANDTAITIDVFIDILNALDSKMLIESNEYCDNLLRQYIDSLNLDITDEKYNEVENFIKQYILFACNPQLRNEMMHGSMNKTKK